MKNIERFRIATKGLAIAPNRFLDDNDPWTDALLRISEKAERAGKRECVRFGRITADVSFGKAQMSAFFYSWKYHLCPIYLNHGDH